MNQTSSGSSVLYGELWRTEIDVLVVHDYFVLDLKCIKNFKVFIKNAFTDLDVC